MAKTIDESKSSAQKLLNNWLESLEVKAKEGDKWAKAELKRISSLKNKIMVPDEHLGW